MTKERIAEIRKRCEDAVEILGGVNAVLVDMFAVLDAVEGVTEDRYRWKARAEALENGIKFLGKNAHTLCKRNACKECEQLSNWEFDEARFAAEADHDC